MGRNNNGNVVYLRRSVLGAFGNGSSKREKALSNAKKEKCTAMKRIPKMIIAATIGIPETTCPCCGSEDTETYILTRKQSCLVCKFQFKLSRSYAKELIAERGDSNAE